jgi:excisionase family DNA binding protein
MSRNLLPLPGSKYADVWQCATYLNVSVACIRKWLSTGKLTRYRAGRRVLVRLEELDAMVVPGTPAESEAA